MKKVTCIQFLTVLFLGVRLELNILYMITPITRFLKNSKQLLVTFFICLYGCGGSNDSLVTDFDLLIISPSTYTVSENRTSIGSAIARVPNSSTEIIYSLSGKDEDSIHIDSSTGTMSFLSAPDYEKKDSYSVMLNVSAGNISASKEIIILISNVSEPIVWVEATPESVGMSTSKLSTAFDKAFSDGSFTQAALVIKDGKLIYERYRGIAQSEESTVQNSSSFDTSTNVQDRWGSKDQNSMVTSWSTAKSFTSVLIAIAIEQGFISSLDQSASDFISEWSNDNRNQITIQDLLDMHSGLEMICANSTTDLSSCQSNRRDGDILYFDNQLTPCINRTMATPGETYPWYTHSTYDTGYYVYSNCDSMVLGEILFRATGKSIEAYADLNLFSKIGMDAEWWQDNDSSSQLDGNYLSFCCIDATIRDFAKFGQLILNNGVLDGDQIIPKSYIDKIKEIPDGTPQNLKEMSPGTSYGLQFWTLTPRTVSDGSTFPAPNTIYTTIGFDGQYIMMDFTNNMLVLRNSLYQAALYRSGERKYVVTDKAATSDFVASLPGGMGLGVGYNFFPQDFLNDITNAID